MNIRAMPAVLSLLVTLIVLFGGYFAHQWFNLEKPMEKAIQSTPHVTLEALRIKPDEIEIRLRTDENFSLAADYIPLQEKLRSLSGGVSSTSDWLTGRMPSWKKPGAKWPSA